MKGSSRLFLICFLGAGRWFLRSIFISSLRNVAIILLLSVPSFTSICLGSSKNINKIVKTKQNKLSSLLSFYVTQAYLIPDPTRPSQSRHDLLWNIFAEALNCFFYPPSTTFYYHTERNACNFTATQQRGVRGTKATLSVISSVCMCGAGEAEETKGRSQGRAEQFCRWWREYKAISANGV